MIALKQVAKSFGSLAVLRGVNLNVQKGEILSIGGESGCGKTTLLRIVAGLERADSGEVCLHGLNAHGVPPHLRNLAFDFQEPALWPHMTVTENIRFVMESPDPGRIRELLEAAEVESLADRFPASLSGGQAKRVALVRALAPRKQILLLDEPVTNLGERLRERMLDLIVREVADSGSTLLCVTHSREEACYLGGNHFVLPELA